MIKTIKCKLNPTIEERMAILQTLDGFALACNLALEVAVANKVHRAFDIHYLCYHQIKNETKLTANHVVRAIARVASSFGKGKHPPKEFKPTSLDLDHNLFKFNPSLETVSLASISGRLKKVKLILGDYQRKLLSGQKPKAGYLSYEKKKNRFYINFCINTETPEPTGTNSLGVDLGINRIVTTSDGFIKSGKTTNKLRERIQRTRSSLQRKGTKGSKRVLKRLSGKVRRTMKDTNHKLSKKLVEQAKQTNSFITFENLEGINERCNKKGKRLRKILGGWSFYELQKFTEYKSALAGVPVIYVDAYNTSKMCSVCFELGVRKKHNFSCSCGNKMDSDINAARNISRLGLTSLSLKSPI